MSNGDNKWIPVKAVHRVIEHNMDMQDLYLPVHFLDLIDDMPTRSMPQWISVKDRLPESSCMVFCFDGFHNFYVTEYSAKHKKFNANDTEGGDFYALETITHWMPIPEPTKEETI